MGDNVKTVERTVKHKVVSYFTTTEGLKADGTWGQVPVEQQARRGETITLAEPEAKRLDSLGAFFSDDELKALAAQNEAPADTAPPGPPVGDVIDLASLSTEETQAWLEGSGDAPKPSVPQVLNAVNAAPEDAREEVAQRVLDAENARSESDPRKSLVEPLQEFLDGDENE
jgi:hypothetical protein